MTLMGLTGGVPRWLPTAMFSSGQIGAFYDPSDLSSTFKDVAGTIPVTADGDLVARINDLSGNGYHWFQATSSLRPVYRTAGGLHWLETDGVDDLMSTGAVFAVMGMPLTLLAAAETAGSADTEQNAVLWMGTGNGVSGANNALAQISMRPSLFRPYAAVRGSGLTPPFNLSVIGGTNTYTTPTVLTGLFVAGHQAVRTNGEERAAGANVWTTQTVTGARLVMGGGRATSGGGVATALVQKYYGIVAIFDEPSSETVALAEAWLASKAGVTL